MPDKISLPALYFKMGDWACFVAVLPFSEIAARVSRATAIHENRGLDDMIQRELSNRVKGIAEYLVHNDERLFSAVVVGVYGGTPNWYPVDIRKSADLGPENFTERGSESLGVLELSGDERLFAIDGQHRIEAIKEALLAEDQLSGDEIIAIFVAHRDSPEGLQRTRRLFTTLNKYAKKVTKSEIIALDEDDAFAILTRRLLNEYEPFLFGDPKKSSLVHFGGSAIAVEDTVTFTSVETLYDLVSILALPRSQGRERNKLKEKRPPDDLLDSMYTEHVAFWEALKEGEQTVAQILDSDPKDELVGNYRSRAGGHILLRTAGQQAFAKATRVLMDRGETISGAVAKLTQTTMELSTEPWLHVLWIPSTRRMILQNQELAESLFLYMVNHEPRRAKFDLLQRYRDAVDDQDITLAQVHQIND